MRIARENRADNFIVNYVAPFWISMFFETFVESWWAKLLVALVSWSVYWFARGFFFAMTEPTANMTFHDVDVTHLEPGQLVNVGGAIYKVLSVEGNTAKVKRTTR